MVEKIMPNKNFPSRVAKVQNLLSNAKYVKNNNLNIWTNSYKVSLGHELHVTDYEVTFNPEIGKDNTPLKERILKRANLSSVSKNSHLYSGNILMFVSSNKNDVYEQQYVLDSEYSTKARNEVVSIKYKITLDKVKSYSFSEKQNANLPFTKNIVELMFNQILKNNPNVENIRRMFVKTNEARTISGKNFTTSFYPGFTTSINVNNNKFYLTIAIRNRFLSTKDCNEIIKEKKTSMEINEIADIFVRRSVKTTYSKRNFIVNNLIFDKNPSNTLINYSGKEVSLVSYYQAAHAIKIKDVKQPLFEIINSNNEKIFLIPELCLLAGVDDNMVADRDFMQNLAQHTKHTPNEKKKITQTFFEMINNKEKRTIKNKKDNTTKMLPSAFETKESLGIKIESEDRIVKGMLMQDPNLKTGKQKLDASKLDRVPVHNDLLSKKKIMIIYHSNNYKDSLELEKLIVKASGDYKFKPIIEYDEVNSNKVEDWIHTPKNLRKEKNNDYVFLFLLDFKQENLYKRIKKSSMSDDGYISQVLRTGTIRNPKKALSAVSKVICQINNKLGGCSYVINSEISEYSKNKLMIIGLDSSHIQGKRTGIAMVASTSADFKADYSNEKIVEEVNRENVLMYMGSFITDSVNQYKKNTGEYPLGIVIYRQGASVEQKDLISKEAAEVESKLNKLDKPIPYYYIIVNNKSQYKFFEKSNNSLSNPQQGLLIVDDPASETNFEFMIQPQKVTMGTATPTQYTVLYGNLNCPSVIPKLTYDLCYIYPNWPGPVRVPNVLKQAEKLSKMTAKYTKSELHADLKSGMCYL